ncbi:MAG: EAL domain-containing protein [Rubrivivax sp.]|nr:EAL domain-containing protein [Rubrivivax sp.]
MPDYNRRAATFWWLVVVSGGLALACSLALVIASGPEGWPPVALGVALAVGAGLFPLRLPGTRQSFSASDAIVFLLLLTQGPAAAALASALETGVGSWRTSRRWTSRIFSPAASALSMGLSGGLLQLLLEALAPGAVGALALLLAVSALHFVVHAQMVAGVLRLKRGEPLVRLSEVFNEHRWVGLTYLGSAAMAGLLHQALEASGPGVLLVMVPVLVMLIVSLHFYFRQQEANEAMREAGAEAAAAAERHLAELQASERRFHAAFTHASIGMALMAFDGRILQANAAMEQLLAVPPGGLVGRSMPELVDPQDREAFQSSLGLGAQREFEAFARELRFRCDDGGVAWVALHCAFFTEPGADEPCLIVQTQDVTARRAAEAGLQHLAFHDPLTGLPNRRRFVECLEGAIQRIQAGSAAPFAVMFLDFDRFKLVNDSLGHGAGDELLVQVARRIQEKLRPHDIVARMGGDEFAILADGIEGERGAVVLAERLTESLRQPFVVSGVELVATASIGITFSSMGYADAESVLRDADIAMYKAKGSGKARYALFDAGLHQAVSERLRLEGELRRAVEQGQLSVEYQPLFELQGGRLSGFEALVRWQHPTRGLLAPASFLAIAEEAELMIGLTDFVLHCACRQLRHWQTLDPSLAELGISVNVSAADLAQPAFVARVSRALVESGLRAPHLTLELTENILMARIEDARHTLTELRRLGVRLAVDDFGTGYSSLSQLSTLPIDSLKIDRSFVGQLAAGNDPSAVVGAIVQLGSALRKGVVAEGIESEAQRALLAELGCGYGQGFHLGSPLSAQAAGDWLMARGSPVH